MGSSVRTGKVTVGHPVDVATGTLFHEFEDFTQPGRFALVFGRRYSTGLIERIGGMFGQGWSSPFEMTLRRDLDGWRLTTEDGESEIGFEGDFDDDQATQPALLRSPGDFCELQRDSPERMTAVKWDPEADKIIRYAFAASGNGEWLLIGAQNAEGHGFTLTRDEQGRIASVRQQREGRGFVLTYGAPGRVIRVHLFGAAGERPILSYSYDQNGRLAEMRDALGNRCQYEYDQAGRMVREVNLGGMEFRFRYDSRGRCVETTGPDGFDHQLLEINEEAKLTLVTGPLGGVTQYQWNASGQVESETSPLGHTKRTVFDEFGRIQQTISASGGTFAYEYDERGDRVKVTDPNGSVTQYQFNDRHLVVAVTDAGGHRWHWRYDERGHPAEWSDPLNNRWAYTYDERGDLTAIRDPLGFQRRFEWDSAGNLVTATDWLDHPTRYQYDAEGRVSAMIDPLGHRTEAEMDGLGRIRRLRHPDGAARHFSWNAYDQITEYVDELGATTTWHYTDCGLVRKIVRPHQGQIQFKYTKVPGQLATVVNENGVEHHYEYDIDGRMVKETDFGGRVTRLEHDPDGLVSVILNNAGHRTELKRNATGGVLAVECDDGTKVTYEYDPRGYLIRADNGDCPVEREYDDAGRMIREKQGEHTITSTFDAAGNRIRRGSSLGQDTAFDWDGNGQVLKIQTGNLDPIRFEYDARQCEIARYIPGGVRINQAFDERGRQIEQWTGGSQRPGKVSVGGQAAQGVHRQYRYDAASNLLETADARWGTTKYRYDAAGRITFAQHAGAFTERFFYDPSDNFLRIDRLTGDAARIEVGEAPADHNWAYSEGNELLRRDGVTYEYDVLGQLLRKVDEEGETRYEWNRLGHLTRAILSNGEIWAYQYDPLSRRVSKASPGHETEFVWDLHVVLGVSESEDQVPAFACWEHKPKDFQPIAHELCGQVFLCSNDTVGRPTALLAKNGAVVFSDRSQAFGTSFDEQQQEIECPIAFPGQWLDSETGLCYNFHRYYEPEAARYISPDPLGMAGGISPYGYVHDPLSWIDPLGLALSGVDFSGSPALFPTTGSQSNIVQITMQGSRGRDFTQAFLESGISRAEAQGYTWHHVDDFDPATGKCTLQLVQTEVHEASFPHKGSVAQFEEHTKTKYDSKEAVKEAEKKGWLKGKPCPK